MRVTALHDASETGKILTVSSGSGPLRGVWRGKSPIHAGQTFDVELEIRRPRHWSDLIAAEGQQSISEGVASVVRGCIVEVFEDRTVALQVGASIILLEMIDESPGESVGDPVILVADDLEFYPTEI
ncbi:hypothetical protein [Parafrankia sp. EUN1f]|uniref:hypothetical protein n=1 Tax=Parafrankia sp. EUN1f TaxID=102897 RepID=UPI000559FE22|nr:hypothetical protein [Parafrankia sp. EUN1f]